MTTPDDKINELRAALENSMTKNRELKAERDALATAVSATYDALDGLYGASKGEKIPYFTLTPDRKATLDKARIAVHKAIDIAIRIEKETGL